MAQLNWSTSKSDLHQVECQYKSENLGASWDATGVSRIGEILEEEACSCGIEDRWVEDGTICDKNVKCVRLRHQYNGKDCRWVDYTPIQYKIGKTLEVPSDECTKVDWEIREGEVVCTGYDKYQYDYYWVFDKDKGEWIKITCDGKGFNGKLIYKNSFDCGYYTTKTTTTYDYGCGDDPTFTSKYPSLTFYESGYRWYTVTITHYWRADGTNNTDETDRNNLNYYEYDTRYSLSYSSNSCNCGYYTLSWYNTDEYACGADLYGDPTNTYKYRKQEQWKVCGGNQLEKTGEFQWVSYQDMGTKKVFKRYDINNTCPKVGFNIESAYRTSSTSYYWTHATSQTNNEFYLFNLVIPSSSSSTSARYYYLRIYFQNVPDFKLYLGESNSSSSYYMIGKMDTHIYNSSPSYSNTNVVYSSYSTQSSHIQPDENRVFTFANDGNAHYIEVVYRRSTSNSASARVVTLGIRKQDWQAIRYNDIYNLCTNQVIETEIVPINIFWNPIKVNKTCVYDAETGCDSTLKTTEYIDDGSFIVDFYDNDCALVTTTPYYKYYDDLGFANDTLCSLYFPDTFNKKSSECGYYEEWHWYGEYLCCGADEVTENVTCSEYGKYQKVVWSFTCDNKETWTPFEPIRIRYGTLVESKSEECGYIPTLEQWVKVCPDVTYENAVVPSECVICQNYQGAPTLFAIEKKQLSYDRGETWQDVYPLQTRTEQILKWKAEKCGYEGDIFEERAVETNCQGIDKYGIVAQFVSSDNGESWSEVPGTRTSKLIELKSTDCIKSTKWIQVSTICEDGNKYAYEQKVFVSNDNQDFPQDEYRKGGILEANAEECQPKVTIDLNSQWQPNTYSGTTLDDYTVYESFSNYHTNNGRAKMIIRFQGYPDFRFMYRSDAESGYDYVMVSKLDTTLTSSAVYNTASVQYNTYSSQRNWYDATYPNDGNEHFIEVVYRKDNSNNTEPDKGFIAIPNTYNIKDGG